MNDNAGTGAAGAVAAVPQRRGRLRPLLSLWPFAARYRGRIALAFAALLIATLATLAVPLASPHDRFRLRARPHRTDDRYLR
jgi:hypothetical protein